MSRVRQEEKLEEGEQNKIHLGSSGAQARGLHVSKLEVGQWIKWAGLVEPYFKQMKCTFMSTADTELPNGDDLPSSELIATVETVLQTTVA